VDAGAVAMGLAGPPVDRVVPGLHAGLRPGLRPGLPAAGCRLAHGVGPGGPVALRELLEVRRAPGPLLPAVVRHHTLRESAPIIATVRDPCVAAKRSKLRSTGSGVARGWGRRRLRGGPG